MIPRRAPGPTLTARSRAGVVRHRVETPRWTAPPVRIALLSDFHAADPWTTLDDLGRIVGQTQALAPDLVVLGGDFITHWFPGSRRILPGRTVGVLAGLSAPLGVFAILGNHDWKDCRIARDTGGNHNSVIEALADSPIRLLRNAAAPLGNTGAWLVGFDSQAPFGRRRGRPAFHDPDAAFAEVPAGAATILAAHEPDWFAEGDRRAVLQLSGHTHGGQANLLGWRPLTPSRFGGRYGWGHFRDGDRHMVVSGGIGFSGVPLRIAAPPEITLIELAGAERTPPGAGSLS